MRAAFYCIADERYFPGAVGLVNSLRLLGHSEPIYVLDTGLTEPQRELLRSEAIVVAGPRDPAPTLLKTIVPLRHPADVMVLIDTDMIATRPLTELIEQAAAGCVVAPKDPLDRFVPEWGELLDLGPARRNHDYVSAGLVLLGRPVGWEVLHLLDELQAKIDFELTVWGRRDPDYPFVWADQDILNAILATRLDRDQFVVVEKRLAAFPPFDGLEIVSEAALQCAYKDGTEPYILHHFEGKPWLETGHSNVYSQLLMRLLFGEDAPMKLDLADVPLWLRPGWAQTEDAALEINSVSKASPKPKLVGCNLEAPVSGARSDPRSLRISGWALGERSAAVAIELQTADGALTRLQIDRGRPDLAQGFPDRPEAERAGFDDSISVLASAPEFELEVRAVLTGGARAPVGAISGRCRSHDSSRYADRVSVVIPCFNQAHFLDEAIESVLSQSYLNLDVLVVDDGSRDNTAEIARRYPGVRYLRQPNAGVAAARNAGLREATGEFLIFLDADDRLLGHAVEVGVMHLREHPNYAFSTGSCRYISQDGRTLDVLRPPDPGDDPFAGLLSTNWAGEPARSIYRRQVLEEIGGFDGNVSPAEDYDLNLRIAREYEVGAHSDFIVERREHAGGASANSGLMLARTLRVARRQRGTARRRGKADAYKASVVLWRSYYGEPLIREVRRAAKEGRRRDATRGLAVLLRHDPRGLGRLLRAPEFLRGMAPGLRPTLARLVPFGGRSSQRPDQATAQLSSQAIDCGPVGTGAQQWHREAAAWARAARQIAASRSWRVGRSLVWALRLLTFRRPASPQGPAELAASIEQRIDSAMALPAPAGTGEQQWQEEAAAWARAARQIAASRSWWVGRSLVWALRLLTFRRPASPQGPAELAASIEQRIDSAMIRAARGGTTGRQRRRSPVHSNLPAADSAVTETQLDVVGVTQAKTPAEILHGKHLTVAESAATQRARQMPIVGWVLPTAGSARAVEVLSGDRLVARAHSGLDRLDIAEAFPDVPHARRTGFGVTLTLSGLRHDVELSVRAVIDGPPRNVGLGSVHVRLLNARIEAPLVSVIIPCYEQAHYLSEAIESALAQTHGQVEVVVVNDGSRDNTSEVAGRYPGVVLIEQRNSGVAASRNAGLHKASGDFLIFLDADDRLLDTAVETGLAELERRPEAECAVGLGRGVGPGGQFLWEGKLAPAGQSHYERLLMDCFIWPSSSILYRREAVEQMGGFNPERPPGDDYELYLNLARELPLIFHDAIVADYRQHRSGVTTNASLILGSELGVLRAQRRYLRDDGERLAWRRGLRRVTEQHGGQALREIRDLQRAGHRWLALRQLGRVVKNVYKHR